MEFIVEALIQSLLSERALDQILDALESRANERVEILFSSQDRPNQTSFAFVVQAGGEDIAVYKVRDTMQAVLKSVDLQDQEIRYEVRPAVYEDEPEAGFALTAGFGVAFVMNLVGAAEFLAGMFGWGF